MKITLNGDEQEIGEEMSLLELLESSGFRGKRVAVEINRQIVPRSLHAERRINAGDRVEIVHAIGGG
ncbi:sulfur carrier protein ThiS [Dokdonella sp.]|uniref:sulfur carrier protein ThiS n=1 Tax=Dokdonella sp. TaxID=2291710 RepID=UPI003C625B38